MPWIFGPPFVGHPNQVEMRELKRFDIPTRAKAFKARTEEFFLKQVDVFQNPQPWAPFPLAVMTCIGIEMVGAYKFGDALGDSNDHFKNLAEEMHSRFKEVHCFPETVKINGKTVTNGKLGYFLYRGFRNSLAHGFYGRWVFITHDTARARTFRYSNRRKILVLNVYCFYKRFKRVCNQYLSKLVSATDPSQDPLRTFNETFEKNFRIWV